MHNPYVGVPSTYSAVLMHWHLQVVAVSICKFSMLFRRLFTNMFIDRKEFWDHWLELPQCVLDMLMYGIPIVIIQWKAWIQPWVQWLCTSLYAVWSVWIWDRCRQWWTHIFLLQTEWRKSRNRDNEWGGHNIYQHFHQKSCSRILLI